MIKVEMRNETASNHYKQPQMGGLGDGSASRKILDNIILFSHAHKGMLYSKGSA